MRGSIACALLVLSAISVAEAQDRYLLLATERTGTLQKEISQAAMNGYTLIALAKRGEHIAILEKAVR
jgi:hypothetical protein